MSIWTDHMDLILTKGRDLFGQATMYERPGYAAFPITGVPQFLGRLEDVNRGEFESIFYRLADFDTYSTFSAFVTAVFTGAPAAGGTITFDGITYISAATLDNGVPYQFFRGTNATTAAGNLAAAINATDGYGGTAYSLATTAHPTCTAFHDDPGPTVVVRLILPGLAGNGTPASESMSFVNLDKHLFYGGGPLVNDLITLENILYRVSVEPSVDEEGGVQLRLENKAV